MLCTQGAIGVAINGVEIYADTDADGGDAYVSAKDSLRHHACSTACMELGQAGHMITCMSVVSSPS
jgi:hypothetical protein